MDNGNPYLTGEYVTFTRDNILKGLDLCCVSSRGVLLRFSKLFPTMFKPREICFQFYSGFITFVV